MHKGGGGSGGRRGSGDGRRGGRGRHPSGLSGKDIGLWYASKSKEKKKKRELDERAVVTMSKQKEQNIGRLLDDLQQWNSNSDTCNYSSDHPNNMAKVDLKGFSRTIGNNSQRHDKHHDREFKHHNNYDNFDERQTPRRSQWHDDAVEGPSALAVNDCRGTFSTVKIVNKLYDKSFGASDSVMDLFDDEIGNEITAGSDSALFNSGDNNFYTNDDAMEGDVLCELDEIIGSLQAGPAQPSPRQDFSPLGKDVKLDEEFLKDLKLMRDSSTGYNEMQKFREKLPSYQMKKEILGLISTNQVVVISGETGCGKTTQVAQFILDDAIQCGNGSLCRIACTQPRRISAISVAERVAIERGEQCGGGSVGYQIRLESRLPRSRGSIIYCTTGVLQRWLVSDPFLKSTSHVIIDEIHERDLMSDFLLIIIRDLLPRRPDLKLVLMSATLNAEIFSTYFGKCPMLHIPGFTYPVKEFYIEEIIEMTRYQVTRSGRSSFGNRRGRGGHGPKWQKYTRRKSPYKDRRAQKIGIGDEAEEEEEEVKWRNYIGSIRNRFHGSTIETMENMDLDQIDFDLAVKLIKYICLNMEAGAILVFMPGWEDISKLHENLKRTLPSDKCLLIPLHSLMPTANQRQVFDRPPLGVRKIVIATNIAETSITIDDVVFVVDCGKVKEKSYDASRKISCLMPVWISTASSRQRRGRAGRVQPGYCFHLFTQLQAQSFIDYQLPEMLRTPLEELCLQIKILKLGMVREFLSKALQPPEPLAVQNALDVLAQLNALDTKENLTPLGYHLASLPVDPRIGKMILFGAILSCLDPVLTVASTLGFREPFVYPLDKKKLADKVRTRLAGDSHSDHIAVLNAYRGWEAASRHGNASTYCWENFLSTQTLKMLSNMKCQFARLLYDSGFLKSSDPKEPSANHNADNIKLVKAILCAGLYPNVARIEHHDKLKRPPRLFTQEDGKVALHPKSVNVEVTAFQNDWLIYHQKIKSSKVFIHDSTVIAPFPLLFFGGSISMHVEQGHGQGHETIAVDNFIKFRSPKRIANLVKDLRRELDTLLERKISQPSLKLSAGQDSCPGSALLTAIIELITSEESVNWKRRRAVEQMEHERRQRR
ncbi:ATP-dependent DNA/RNA helicase DHX36 isoform X2 [Nematostella vectensis]|uniref:ATP-dependent DNA/RNA helicase DHX36 isoform X2 n=1 Tax=Nematostella vectensis TaxID=45351 RepID=UPI0020777FB0|nr:ATP-dependent DNA/RNA helicase DHX36 isoform X2 [Nematostella vectensis]